MAFARFLIINFIGLTILYLLLSILFRRIRRARLERRFTGPDRLERIEHGMAEYHRSLRKKLLLLVYVIPVVATVAIVYAVNIE